jgi:two-component system response regulator RegA
MITASQAQSGTKPGLLLVDDDDALSSSLARALDARGFDVRVASTGTEATRLIGENPPAYAIIDLKLPDGYGLELVARLAALDPCLRIVVVTGFSSIPSAVEAIKLGATYYLAKPASVNDIVDALHRDGGNDSMPPNGKPLSLKRLEWEYIHRVLQQNRGNIAATARALSIHRRTLQRKISKHPVRR